MYELAKHDSRCVPSRLVTESRTEQGKRGQAVDDLPMRWQNLWCSREQYRQYTLDGAGKVVGSKGPLGWLLGRYFCKRPPKCVCYLSTSPATYIVAPSNAYMCFLPLSVPNRLYLQFAQGVSNLPLTLVVLTSTLQHLLMLFYCSVCK